MFSPEKACRPVDPLLAYSGVYDFDTERWEVRRDRVKNPLASIACIDTTFHKLGKERSCWLRIRDWF